MIKILSGNEMSESGNDRQPENSIPRPLILQMQGCKKCYGRKDHGMTKS